MIIIKSTRRKDSNFTSILMCESKLPIAITSTLTFKNARQIECSDISEYENHHQAVFHRSFCLFFFNVPCEAAKVVSSMKKRSFSGRSNI